jgi:hypothetical protein
MILVVLVMLVLVPLFMMMAQKTRVMNHLFWRNRVGDAARRISDNLVMDYMSQFAKGTAYYEDHFSSDFLQRTKTFFESGFASVNVAVDPASRTVQVTATGDYGHDASSPISSKSLSTLIHFVPLIGQYVTSSSGGLSFQIAGMIVDGPVRVGSGLSVTAGNVTFNDVVIAGTSINAPGSTRFNSQVFYGTTLSPAYSATVYTAGVPVKEVPPGSFFQIDRDFYRVNSTTQSLGVNVEWNFQVNAGIAQYRSRYDINGNYSWDAGENWSPLINIPADGGIFYVQDAKTYLSGTVGSRVTIVCAAPRTNVGPASLDNMGIIEIQGPDFGYVPPGPPPQQAFANATQSLFVIGSYGFHFRVPAATPNGTIFRFSGAYYLANPVYDDPDCGGASIQSTTIRRDGMPPIRNTSFNLLGSWNDSGVCNHFMASPNPLRFQFDPNLQRFPAPGVPERPVLLNWRRR